MTCRHCQGIGYYLNKLSGMIHTCGNCGGTGQINNRLSHNYLNVDKIGVHIPVDNSKVLLRKPTRWTNGLVERTL